MLITGEAVIHAAFGRGTVVDMDGQTVTVRFPGAEKKFLFPDAFLRYLKLEDATVQQAVQELVRSRKEAAAAAMRERLDAEYRQQRLRDLRPTPNSQAVFDLRGAAAETVFRDWTISTGVFLSGSAKGLPRTPDRMKPNSVCLLTTRPEGKPEAERVVLGAFLAPEDFFGDLCRDGVIPAHPTYRLRLETTGEPVRFWDSFPPAERQQRWGSMAFKYLSEERMQTVLWELKERLQHTEQAAAARELYHAYCRLNRLRTGRPGESAAE